MTTMKPALQRLMNIRSDFERLFFTREYSALAGHRQKALVALTAILFFTFLALGFAAGSLGYLRLKMENPYTNWVDLPVSQNHIARQAASISSRYENEDMAKAFQLRSTDGFNKYTIDFYESTYSPFLHPADTLTKNLWGRTIQGGEPLLDEILNPLKGNLVWRLPAFDPSSFSACDLIVTEQLLENLGYKQPDSLGYLCVKDLNAMVFLRVAAVVKELPSLSHFVTSPKLYNILTAKRDKDRACQDLILLNQATGNRYSLLTEAGGADRIESLARTFFEGKKPSIYPGELLSNGSKSYQTCTLAFLPVDAPSIDSVSGFVKWAKDSVALSAYYAPLDCGNEDCAIIPFKDYHYLAFHFNRLNRIRAFSADLRKTFNIDIDISQVEAKENFAFVSQLTLVISLTLMAFAILSIVFFVNNLLRTHLFEVRANLGTFQAFGLDRQFLVRIYLKIVFAFLAISVAVAYALSVLVDRAAYFLYREESTFNIFNGSILVAIAGLLAVSLLFSAKTIRNILTNTPGNLIYER